MDSAPACSYGALVLSGPAVVHLARQVVRNPVRIDRAIRLQRLAVGRVRPHRTDLLAVVTDRQCELTRTDGWSVVRAAAVGVHVWITPPGRLNVRDSNVLSAPSTTSEVSPAAVWP